VAMRVAVCVDAGAVWCVAFDGTVSAALKATRLVQKSLAASPLGPDRAD
jgi:hypothetical protein